MKRSHLCSAYISILFEENEMYLCALAYYFANPLICNLLPQIIMKLFINNKNLLWYHHNVAVNHVRIILPVI